ncbi:MAG: response regulator [Candidatus Kerfeldbacteria bacterium]|nr:response regulator [Candidatus Kerfeldbacteria bacterium]
MVKKKPTVLLVEDEKMLADMYATKFSMEGFATHKAYDGQAGLRLAQDMKPDIILLDIIMPKLDGFAVLKALRQDPSFKSTPVLLLTNLGQDEDIKKGQQLGATDYFVKANHTPAEVVNKVRTILRQPV